MWREVGVTQFKVLYWSNCGVTKTQNHTIPAKI